MTPFNTKIVCAALTVVLSAFFGALPFFFRSKVSVLNPNDPSHDRMARGSVFLAFLLNFSGGVLIANCFCHWLPEVREGLDHHDIDTVLPLAEVIMCAAFFAICLLEEIIHYFVHKHLTEQEENKIHPEKIEFDREGALPRKVSVMTQVEENLTPEREEEDLLSAIRTFFVVSALSFHSVIEGLALSFEDEAAGVWTNFGAVAMHKFVIAFAMGVELVSVKVSRLQFIISIGVFSLAPAVGVTAGMLLDSDNVGDEAANINDFVIQVLQGIATGTIVYVVFFEIFPKARSTGGNGFQHVIAMILGFAIFLPSLLFHEHEHEE